MEMIVLDAYLADPPPVHLAGLVQQPFQTDGYFALQHALPELGNPYQMILESMLCMSPTPVSGHSQIMPERTSAPPARAGCAPGCHSSPGLKAWGFLAWAIKAQTLPARIWEIDFLRGLSIILMVFYHALYDLTAPAEKSQTPTPYDHERLEIVPALLGLQQGDLLEDMGRRGLRRSSSSTNRIAEGLRLAFLTLPRWALAYSPYYAEFKIMLS
jgi:hypothetical protein